MAPSYRSPLAVLLAASVLATACAKKEEKPDLGDPKDYQVVVVKDADYTEPRSFSRGVGIHARAEASAVVISLKNSTEGRVTLTWRDLALIKGPDKAKDFALVSPEIADIRAFAPLELEPGASGARRLLLRGEVSAKGMRLVYNNPRERIRLLTPIE